MDAPLRPSAGDEPAPLDFGGAVLLVVAEIPPGRVMTYGDVAAALGSRGARAVGRVMALEGSSLPWWRVVRADARPPAGHEAEALEHYEQEATPLRWTGPRGEPDAYRLDLAACRWAPAD
ncbi:MGMT family protein [Microcella daejeonensis]|uniref:MGMT family protein n=1 Tax=Microcella daejeonensis TaxID=2994971 RepID=A0A9E8MIR5_9MICO|nr:MGMT family protein [Microcella daejeonensis]WAB80320.1 MGMT family protein [Microcella daejeonensis]